MRVPLVWAGAGTGTPWPMAISRFKRPLTSFQAMITGGVEL
jgi:hypothetical protein